MKKTVAALALIGTLLFAQQAAAEPRIALIIGNANYGPDIGQLKNPVNDAQLMDRTLRGVGFQVVRYENANRRTMRQAIKDFGKRLTDAGPSAVGIFYYAGHGFQSGGRNWLVPVGAVVNTEADAEDETVRADYVLEVMDLARNQLNIVILDACRNNPFTRSFRSVQRGLAPVQAPSNSVVAYSTAPGAVAADGAGANSPYARALAAEISSGSDPIQTLMVKVTARVKVETGSTQRPFVSSSLDRDDFRFRALAARPAGPAATGPSSSRAPVPEDEVEIEAWRKLGPNSSLAEWEAFYSTFPNGRYARMAQAKITELRRQAAAKSPVQQPSGPQPSLMQPSTSPATQAAPSSSPPSGGVVASRSVRYLGLPAGRPARSSDLGARLTPAGAEKAGLTDARIPDWSGGLTAPPAGVRFDPRKDNPPDPFPVDRPYLEVTGDNADQYGGYLTDGHKAMLKAHGDYKMKIYPTRRTCATPFYVYSATRANADISQLTSDGDGIQGGIMGVPFPLNRSAQEIMWNARLRFNGFKWKRQFATAPVQSNGSYDLVTTKDESIVRWANPAVRSVSELNNIIYLYIAKTIAPARIAGNVILVHESSNPAVDPRKAWAYSSGTRRVRRAPDIAYDNPGNNIDGMSTSDSFGGFNGAMDRYDWSIKGRRAAFIPYNDYKVLHAKYVDLLKLGHINQDVVRYEAHRVWTVEAKLKPGSRHVYARRVFYVDEDSYMISAAENYDGRGQLWRMQEQMTVNYYHVPLCGIAGHMVYDLLSGRYLATDLIGEEPPINFFADDLQESRYTPEAIRDIGQELD